MNQEAMDVKIDISIGGPEGDQHLLIRVAHENGCSLHLVTLAEARAMSLEIVRQVGRAEGRMCLNPRPVELAPIQAFSFRRPYQC